MLHLGDIKIAQKNNLAASSLPQSGKTGHDYTADASFFSLLQGQVKAGDQVVSITADRPEPLKNTGASAVNDRAPREESSMNVRTEEIPQAIGRAEEQGHKAAAQVQGNDVKNADMKNTAEKKGLTDQQGNQIEKNTDAGARTRQKHKEKRTGDAEMHDLRDGLHRMIDFFKGKDQPEIQQIKASVQELHDLLRDTKQNPDRAALKKVFDKLASSIDGYIRSAHGGKPNQAAASLAGFQEALKKSKAVDDKNQARKNAGSVEAAVPAVKDLLAKIEFILDGVKGDGSHHRSGANDQGNAPSFSFTAVKGDVSAKHADVAAAAPKSNLFRENLESVIQNARVVVRDGRNGSFSVRLHPEELGTVSINLKLHEGVVQGSFLVETREARDLIAGNLDYIRQQLSDAGITVGEFHVNVNDQRGRMLHDRTDDHIAVIAPSEQSVEIESEYMANAMPYHNGQINLVI
ncbi:MAG TPA: flagellar hook-length control protein FliK [Spirochaetota bacterium]|nr:flagellar hook-length control protein FliK [Spirochaetota bacterium]